jgi:hypothetical protein
MLNRSFMEGMMDRPGLTRNSLLREDGRTRLGDAGRRGRLFWIGQTLHLCYDTADGNAVNNVAQPFCAGAAKARDGRRAPEMSAKAEP